MEVVRSRQRPRCADCGSSAVILEGQCAWHLPTQAWRAVQPQLDTTSDGTMTVRDPRSGFFCQDCETNVAVKMGPG